MKSWQLFHVVFSSLKSRIKKDTFFTKVSSLAEEATLIIDNKHREISPVDADALSATFLHFYAMQFTLYYSSYSTIAFISGTKHIELETYRDVKLSYLIL